VLLCAVPSPARVCFPSKRSAVTRGQHRRQDGPGPPKAHRAGRQFVRSSSMNNPGNQWSPYWWQTVTAAPSFGWHPNEDWTQTSSSWAPPAVSLGVSSGILGAMTQPANESSDYPLPKATNLLGQFLTGAGMAQASQSGLQTETDVGKGGYSTPAASRSSNMAHCLERYIRCHDLHSFGLLINGKRCKDCFDMCTLYGSWPDNYWPLRPF